MDAANKRDPQDGAFSFSASGRKIDVRVSMVPHENGASLVMRILDSANVSRKLSSMGFEEDTLAIMTNAVQHTQGTIIVCGPTGSGKTTTLYALLQEVATDEKNVVTIEDPIEYRLPLVNQLSVSRSGDRRITFAKALRASLRQDPDVILVGEIRDEETAQTDHGRRYHGPPRPFYGPRQRCRGHLHSSYGDERAALSRRRGGQPRCQPATSAQTPRLRYDSPTHSSPAHALRAARRACT